MEATSFERTSIERSLKPEAILALKDATEVDLSVSGPTRAGDMLRYGLVDELAFFIVPVVVGAGSRFLPAKLSLNLALVEEHRVGSGTLFLRYAIQP